MFYNETVTGIAFMGRLFLSQILKREKWTGFNPLRHSGTYTVCTAIMTVTSQNRHNNFNFYVFMTSLLNYFRFILQSNSYILQSVKKDYQSQ